MRHNLHRRHLSCIGKNMNGLKITAKRCDSGFTIVELLIVIVVVAVLAAVTVVAYNGMQSRALDSTILSNLANIKRKLELKKVDLGHYPQTGAEMSDLKADKGVLDTTQNNFYYCVDKVNDQYAVGMRSKRMKGFILISNASLQEGVTVYGSNTCATIGKTFVTDATTYATMGYDSATTNWASWTN